ncbi:hypothetical protein NECAME_07462 [Necator americanus]|uniref:NadR/Ttd14 AAA domain-containing protein n=1 Tax=Necator americanus TaxID=51031 RepID=W2TNN9_NECAM|nr:hypothetical protein NECAME_07462 [Necator americanus]ETN83274.1 hypothetical protein NECAME_07462 [Necator americanus]
MWITVIVDSTMAVNLCSVNSLNTSKVYKLVLTGGPCGGKTTGQDRLATFFENIGWKVFTVPETATILLGGRVKFEELNCDQAYLFQKDLLKTMLQIEDTFFNQAAATVDRNVLIICDRGGMDPSAYIDRVCHLVWILPHTMGRRRFDTPLS